MSTLNSSFQQQREIGRLPECPVLSDGKISEVTNIVFVPSNPQRADLLFVFGSSSQDKWAEVVALYLKGFAPTVYIAGKSSDDITNKRILSHVIREEFIALGVPTEAIVVDEMSTNTLEDAVNGKKIFMERKIPHDRILFCCKAPHSGRCLRTLRKIFPDSELLPFTYEFTYKGSAVQAKDWWKNEFSRSAVWGEYLRIKLYSSRGQICP